jgi:hypothetical protein
MKIESGLKVIFQALMRTDKLYPVFIMLKKSTLMAQILIMIKPILIRL